ncbi:hypothetical protein ACIQNI_09785 [Streptomyces sp. NPDC091266]|uniref:hypothetical protein n=1 Tax=Streptomyces sp. NPDC091266 TaxID=3365978 RepID=UPI0037F70D38
MAKIRVGALCRFLLIVAAVVLALPAAAALPALVERAPAYGTAGPAASSDVPQALDATDHPESAADRCQPRRGGRSAPAASAPTPLSTPLSTACSVRPVGGSAVTVPLAARQAVPLSRSGELPVRYGVFRC